mmetsp:Transcript_10228/g.20502  ORF Transcript_10228/g.20502 Transcript_10228/m.20502 type:complete len:97 (-) Transcript_10228:865-1155(-)
MPHPGGSPIDGIQASNQCISGCPRDGPGGAWAHREGVKRLRALKRTLKAEFRARDAYERGNFASAAKIYGEMVTEYLGTMVSHLMIRVVSGVAPRR